MNWDDGAYGKWEVAVDLKTPLKDGILSYQYVVMRDGHEVRRDGFSGGRGNHTLDVSLVKTGAVLEVRDQWRVENSIESVFSTAAFQECVFYR
jgi:hypothetical protein